jgi:3'-phosphoadenosine 5'-phosphosulfate sulfotransferase (PAPS reductase)/FAD synthetase
MDTKWEHPATLEYIKHYLPDHIGPIKMIGEPMGLPGLVRKKQLFPLMNARFCTGVLKLDPMRKHLNKKDTDIVNAVGIRAEESADRSRQPMWEYSKELDAEVWRPLLNWTEQDVIDIHTAHNMLPNPLYLMGAERVGCWPCIFSTKRAIRIMTRDTPERIDQIRRLEREVNIKRRRNNPKAKRVSWFYRNGRNYPIDEVVAWAANYEGNAELFAAEDHHKGCMKWGLCDISHPIQNQKDIIEEKQSTTDT